MTPENIKALRYNLGISKTKLSEKLGVDRNTITHWETGKTIPRGQHAQAISDIFGDISDLTLPEESKETYKQKKRRHELEEKKAQEIANSIKAMTQLFTEGKCNTITESKDSSSNALQKFILRYEGKRGIHHVFREVVGKWIVTYTDAQLIGKFIREVDENGT